MRQKGFKQKTSCLAGIATGCSAEEEMRQNSKRSQAIECSKSTKIPLLPSPAGCSAEEEMRQKIFKEWPGAGKRVGWGLLA